MIWTNRYQVEKTLSIRVWPQGDLTFRKSMEASEWSVDGMTINRNERMVVCHKLALKLNIAWEIGDADLNRLAAAGHAGAKFGKMVVRTPGTKYNNAKMECWLEVPLTLNPKAWKRTVKEIDPVMRGSEEQIAETVKATWEQDLKRAGNWMHEYYGFTERQQKEYIETLPKREFTGIHYLVNPALANLDALAEAVLKGKAILVDYNLRNRLDIREIDRALDCWTVKGAEPDAEGGEFNPLQLGRSVFWCEDASIPEWMRGDGKEAIREYKKDAHEEMMRARTQKYYIEHVTTRVAKRYGISRERVAARLVEEGFFDWMVEESDKIWNDPTRAHLPGVDAKSHAAVDEGTKIICFAIDSMAIRPPAPVPPLLTDKQKELRLEYRRKKLDAFNALPKEEQERILAKKAHRERNRPENIAKRIIAAYAQQEGQETDAAHAELVSLGIFDLILNGLKTRKDAGASTCLHDEQAKFYERIGPKVIRLLKRCRSGEAVDARRASATVV